MPTIKFFKDDINALLLLPDSQFVLAIKTILSVHDTISGRDTYKNYVGKSSNPSAFEKIDLPDMAKKRVMKIVSEMPEDIERYWKRAEINAVNRAGGKK